MQKYFYPIFKLPDFYVRDYQKQELPLWVKFWLLGKAGRELSEILTGSEFTLLHTIQRKFKLLQFNGNTEQTQLSGKNLFDVEDWYNTLHNLDSNAISKETINGIEYIKFSASNSSIRNYKFMQGKFKENTQYVILAKALRYNNEVTSTGLRIAYTDGTSQEAYISQTTEYNYVIISQANKTINYINLCYANTGFALIRNIQLEEGSTETSYEPYCGGIPAPNPRL